MNEYIMAYMWARMYGTWMHDKFECHVFALYMAQNVYHTL